jgi:hypothetical protein
LLDVCKISKSCSGANRQADSRGLIVVVQPYWPVVAELPGAGGGSGYSSSLLVSHADAMMPASAPVAPSLAHAQASRFSVRCKVMRTCGNGQAGSRASVWAVVSDG